MSEKRDEVEKIVNEIYCDLGLDGQEDWDRVSEILYRAFTKPAVAQSAEELAYKLQEFGTRTEVPKCKSTIEAIKWYENAQREERDEWVKIIEADRAAQRQAGRNEALVEMADNAIRLKKHYDDALAVIDARYTALVEAARPFAQYEDGDAGKCWDPSRIKLGKALDDLGEARKR